MKISLKRNGGPNSQQIPYFAHIEIATITVDLEREFQVPISLGQVNNKKVYLAEVCGFQVEGDQPEIVVNLIAKLVAGLVNMARLPTYVFIARRSHKMYPVYTFGNEVFATTPGGPIFKHVELAKVREYLAEYLNEIGELGVPGKSEKLHVRGVRRSNLALTRPIFYLKKRPQANDEKEFWGPVFVTDDNAAIYTYAASGRRQVDVNDGHEILALRSQVAQALIADKRLKDEYALRADRLLPEYWQKVKPNLQALSSKLRYNGTAFEMYQDGKHLVAVEYRPEEDRYSFYIGKGVSDLRDRATEDLMRRGLVKNLQTVQVDGWSA